MQLRPYRDRKRFIDAGCVYEKHGVFYLISTPDRIIPFLKRKSSCEFFIQDLHTPKKCTQIGTTDDFRDVLTRKIPALGFADRSSTASELLWFTNEIYQSGSNRFEGFPSRNGVHDVWIAQLGALGAGRSAVAPHP
ncbi:MAG: hypothetical protein MO852_03620 [Candidatus Devosia euplotis]|nr:hypothetical protein [Candidatus Devosia euplotis]